MIPVGTSVNPGETVKHLFCIPNHPHSPLESTYFSDIIGFNDVALSAAPIQIVNLLNSIYGLVSIHIC